MIVEVEQLANNAVDEPTDHPSLSAVIDLLLQRKRNEVTVLWDSPRRKTPVCLSVESRCSVLTDSS